MTIDDHYPLIQIIGVTIAALSMGFVFGIQFTGRLATAGMLTAPEWMSTAQTAQTVALAVVVVAVLGATVIEVNVIDG